MRKLLFASVCIVVISEPALACRGTYEYPQTAKQLEQSMVSAEFKKDLMERLMRGQAKHDEGHSSGNMREIAASIRILDGIKAQIPR